MDRNYLQSYIRDPAPFPQSSISRIVNQLGGSADGQLHTPYTWRKTRPIVKAEMTEILSAIIGIMLNGDEEENKHDRK